MVPTRIQNRAAGIDAVAVDPAQAQSAIVHQAEAITTSTITEHYCALSALRAISAIVVERNLGRTRALDPCREGEVLQPQTGRITHVHSVPAHPVKNKSLADHPWPITYHSSPSDTAIIPAG